MDKKSDVGTRTSDLTYANLLPGTCAPAKLLDVTAKQEISGNFSVHDPVQGCLGDCYFMAALASVAWAAPGILRAYAVNGGVTSYSFFPDNERSPVPVFAKAVPASNTNVICYARIPAAPRNVTAIWPLLYEKAYSIYRGAGTTSYNWNLLNGGPNVATLQTITGWDKEEPGVANWKNVPNENKKAVVPAVAWTDARAQPAGIYPNHSYSYLGYYTQNGIDYLVLRNPYGPLKLEPTANVCRTDIAWHNTAPNQINLSNAGDGIFALKAATFIAQFKGIGYVEA